MSDKHYRDYKVESKRSAELARKRLGGLIRHSADNTAKPKGAQKTMLRQAGEMADDAIAKTARLELGEKLRKGARGKK